MNWNDVKMYILLNYKFKYTFYQLMFDKYLENAKWGKDSLFNSCFWEK